MWGSDGSAAGGSYSIPLSASMPKITLEEIFIYELGGTNEKVKDILL